MRAQLATILFVGFWLTASAMDRWAALSMLESGDNDNAVGPGGEVSRFQIQHALWPGGDPRNPRDALTVAKKIMGARLNDFERTHKRPATDFEFYVLWNAPSQIERPHATVVERARRFANLVAQKKPARAQP